MQTIDISIQNKKVGELFFDPLKKDYGFNYTCESSPISLTMPYQKSTYTSHYHLHPIFEMNLPEGYLYEVFKGILSKEYGYIDDFLVLSYLAPHIEGRLSFDSQFDKRLFEGVDIDEILYNDSDDTFHKLLKTFLGKNAISGVQPKTLALIKDKESLVLKEYIVKTWGVEYPRLAQNEYYSMRAVQKAGVAIPNLQLSKNKKFLLVEKFTYDKKRDIYLGFEEILVLMGKNRDKKYSGSYEQIAKLIYAVTTDKAYSMKQFYQTIAMNYLLKNGDAHLKNFGILYDNSFESILFAPAYDVINTVVYIHSDKPALTMFGKKVWWGKKELIEFGIKHCYLSTKIANNLYDKSIQATIETIAEIKDEIQSDPKFELIGERMIESWNLSLDEKTYKELPLEIRRDWKKDKRA